MSSSFPSPPSPSHDRTLGSSHLRNGGRFAVSSPKRVARLDRLDSDPYVVPAASASSPLPNPLHLASLIASNSFAKPSYAISPVPSPSHAVRRKASPNAWSGRRDHSHPPSPANRRGGRSPTTVHNTTASAEEHELTLVTLPLPPSPTQRKVGSAATSPIQRGSPRGRSRQRLEENQKARRAGFSRKNNSCSDADTAWGGAAATLSSSPLYSTPTPTSSASGNAGGNGNGMAASVSPAILHVSGAPNPLRPTHVTLEGPAEASASVSGGGGGGGGNLIATASPAPAPLIPTGPSKEHCSHCKVEDEELYLCPCGLARYCSTTCQRAHWSFHRAVCSNAVRAVEPSWRRCDWCGTSSQTLRRCGCGFAYYCDVHCQRADWPYHRLVCSTVTSEAIVTALLGGPAPRTTREAATQTAHWQINVPVLRSLARPDASAQDSRGVSGYASTSQPCPLTGSDSFGEAYSPVGNSVANNLSFPRLSRTQPLPWEHNSQLPAESVYTDTTLSNSRSTSAMATAGHDGVSATGHVDPAHRTLRSHVHSGGGGGGNGASPRASSSRHSQQAHHRSGSLYESLNLTASQQEPLSTAMVHFHSDTEMSPTASKGLTGQSNVSVVKCATLSGVIIGPGSRHSYGVSEMDAAGDGTGVSNSIPSSAVFSPVRDQPSLLAFAATSQRKIESDEQKEWAELNRQFYVERVSIELKVLPRLEEEQRMVILKEEVMWCVVTGNPTAKDLKQRLLLKVKQ